MRPDSARIAQQITTFGHPLAQLVQERQLTVRMAFPGNMNWVRLITRWHQRYERELRNAGREGR